MDRLTWGDRVTPSGQTIVALRASVPRTSGKGSGSSRKGWNTPRATDGKNGGPNQAGGALSHDADLSGWVTPTVRDWKDTPGMKTERPDGRARLDQLPRQATMAGWPTPRAVEAGPGHAIAHREQRGGSSTPTVSAMGGPAGVPTAGRAADWGANGTQVRRELGDGDAEIDRLLKDGVLHTRGRLLDGAGE